MPYLEDMFVEPADADFDPKTDIQEMFELPGTQPGGGESFTLENGEAVLVYLIDWHKTRSFLKWAVGYAYSDEGDPYKMYRVNPQYHPRYPWLSVSGVHFSAVAPKSNPLSGVPTNAPNFPAVVTNTDGSSIPKTG